MASMKGEGMAKRSIGSLMRKKLSDITNSQPQPKLPSIEENLPENLPANQDCIEQLLNVQFCSCWLSYFPCHSSLLFVHSFYPHEFLVQERVTLLQLLAERNKIIELSGAEQQRLRTNIQKLQLQNWNLAQSNSHMLAELNLGRERIKALQHDIVCRAALLKGMNFGVEGKVETRDENNIPLSQEVEEKPAQPPPRASNNEEKNSSRNRRRNMRRSTGSSSTASTRDASKKKSEDKRPSSRRHSAKVTTHEREALEDLFEIEDAKYPAIEGTSGLANQGPRSSFGRPMRKAAEKVQSYKEIPLNVKMRRLE